MKRPFLLFLFCLFASAGLPAQKQHVIDSLAKLLPNAPDTQKVRLHVAISFTYSRLNVDSALVHAEKGLALANQLNDSMLIANAMLQLGLVQVNMSKYDEGIENALKAYHIFEKNKDNGQCAYACNILGNAYVGFGYKEQALEWYKSSLSFAEKSLNQFKISVALFGIANMEYDMKMEDSALVHYQRCEVLFKQLGKKREAAASLLTHASILFDKGYYQESLSILLSTQKDVEALNDLYFLGYFYKQTGACYRELKKYDRALESEYKALFYFRQIKELANVRDVYRDIAKTHSAAGNSDSAYYYLGLFADLNDSLFNSENSQKIAEMQTRFETAEKDKKILKSDMLIQQQSNQKKLLLVGLALMLVLAVLAGLSYRRKRRDNLVIAAEKQKSDELLLNILPAETAEELKQHGSAKARTFEMVTVMFTDFKDFTSISAKLSADELVAEINECFVAFDLILQRHGVEKIKTIGDAYMAAGGLPTPKATHAVDVVKAAIEIQDYVYTRKKEKGEMGFDIRIGIHSGPVVAGIVGIKKFAYDIWGDTVNTASRMESNGVAGRINVSKETYELVKDQFYTVPRGKIQVKGKGEIEMYFVGNSSSLHVDYKALHKYVTEKMRNELSTDYYYHNLPHTLDVIESTERLALGEGVTDEETLLILKTAALLHDIGFLEEYPDNEPTGARIAGEILPEFGYSQEQIGRIKKIILATSLKVIPETLEEQIVKDADLDYLGREDYKLLSLRLKQEWEHQDIHKTMPEWYELQIKFLTNHRYYTKSALEQREPGKQKQLEEIKKTAEMWSKFEV